MTRNELNNAYFEWMYQLVCGIAPNPNKSSYRKLLFRLHDIDFDYTIAMDGNRAEDGINLRYRFGDECSYPDTLIASYLDVRPCSVLEMLIALAIRCEEHIMCDPDIGNRTKEWFWSMIENLGLTSMHDSNFDKYYVDEIVERFLNREYKRNGEGGLFTVKHCKRDLRSVEIWYQMSWYLDEILQS